jgi:hypothetical protein
MRQNPDQETTSERDALEQYLDYQRETILLKTEGLTREQLGQKIQTSDLTLAGILYHLALNEEAWFEVDFLGRQPGPTLGLHPDRGQALHPALGAAASHRGNRAPRRTGRFAP